MSDIYNGTKTAFMDGGSGGSVYTATEMPLNLAGDTLGVLLASDSTSYTFSATDADYVGDLFDGGTTAAEFSGTGYSPQNLSSLTITEDNTNKIRVTVEGTEIGNLTADDGLPFQAGDQATADNTTAVGGDSPVISEGDTVRIVWVGEERSSVLAERTA